eukprot:scaffold834_cov244-Pinguiococcus_pyrenoidosus.AAC.24
MPDGGAWEGATGQSGTTGSDERRARGGVTVGSAAVARSAPAPSLRRRRRRAAARLGLTGSAAGASAAAARSPACRWPRSRSRGAWWSCCSPARWALGHRGPHLAPTSVYRAIVFL